MTTIYRKKGAVHGFAIEFYRVTDAGAVEYCDPGGNWQPSNMSRWDMSEQVEAMHFERLPWACYRDDSCPGLHYRVAGPFIEERRKGEGGWKPLTHVWPSDVTEAIERGEIIKVEAPE